VEVCDRFCCKRCEASHFQSKVANAVEHGRFCERISGSGFPVAVPARTQVVRSALSTIMDIPLEETMQEKVPRHESGGEHLGGQFCLLCRAWVDQNHLASRRHVTQIQCETESTVTPCDIERSSVATSYAPTLNYDAIMDATDMYFYTPHMRTDATPVRAPAETRLVVWSPGPPPELPLPPPPPPPPAAYYKNRMSTELPEGVESFAKWQTPQTPRMSAPAKQLALPDPHSIKRMADSTAQHPIHPEDNYAFTEREHAILCELTGFLTARARQKVHSNTT